MPRVAVDLPYGNLSDIYSTVTIRFPNLRMGCLENSPRFTKVAVKIIKTNWSSFLYLYYSELSDIAILLEPLKG
jgi:hypothetical protein